MLCNLLAHMAKLVVSQQNAVASEESADDAGPDLPALLRVLTPTQPTGHLKQKVLTMIPDRVTGTVRSSIRSL